MRKIFCLLITILAAAATMAQVYRGEGGNFAVRYNLGSTDRWGIMRLNEPIGTVCCYIDSSGKVIDTTFVIYFVESGQAIDVKKAGEAIFLYADGSREVCEYKAFVRSIELLDAATTRQVGVEVNMDLSTLKRKLLQQLVIEGNRNPIEIAVPGKTSKKLPKAVAKSEQLALKNAIAAKVRKESYERPLTVPDSVAQYLARQYPGKRIVECSRIDTIEFPVRTLLSLNFSARLEAMNFARRVTSIDTISGMAAQQAAVKRELLYGDSIVGEFAGCMDRIDSMLAREKMNRVDGYHNYQRVTAELSDTVIDVYTRVGEGFPSAPAMRFWEMRSETISVINQFAALLEDMRKLVR